MAFPFGLFIGVLVLGVQPSLAMRVRMSSEVSMEQSLAEQAAGETAVHVASARREPEQGWGLGLRKRFQGALRGILNFFSNGRVLEKRQMPVIGTWREMAVEEGKMRPLLELVQDDLNSKRRAKGCSVGVTMGTVEKVWAQETATQNFRMLAHGLADAMPIIVTVLIEIDTRSGVPDMRIQLSGVDDVCELQGAQSAVLLQASQWSSDDAPVSTIMRDIKVEVRHPPLPDVIPDSYSVLTDHENSARCFTNSDYVVPDQGSCGSCFAMASAGVAADRACLAKSPYEMPSVQHFFSCYRDDGCAGGHQVELYERLFQTGLTNEKLVPYKVGCWTTEEGANIEAGTSISEHCPFGETSIMPDQDQCDSYAKLPLMKAHKINNLWNKQGDSLAMHVKRMQAVILEGGPVDADFHIFADFRTFFQFNPTGVYRHNLVAPDRASDHSVAVLGWGTQDGLDYWLCRNTWGPDWADKGYFKIQRGVNMVGIESAAYWPEMPTNSTAHAEARRVNLLQSPELKPPQFTKSLKFIRGGKNAPAIELGVKMGSFKTERFVYDQDGLLVQLRMWFTLECFGKVGKQFEPFLGANKDPTLEACSMPELSYAPHGEGNSTMVKCHEDKSCQITQDPATSHRYFVYMQVKSGSPLDGVPEIDFIVEGESIWQIQGEALGKYRQPINLPWGERVEAPSESNIASRLLAWDTRLSVNTQNKASESDQSLMVTMSCSRPCKLGNMKLLNKRGTEISSWSWDVDAQWEGGIDQFMRLSHEQVMKTKRDLLDDRQMTFQWTATDLQTGESRTETLEYELDAAFGVVQLDPWEVLLKTDATIDGDLELGVSCSRPCVVSALKVLNVKDDKIFGWNMDWQFGVPSKSGSAKISLKEMEDLKPRLAGDHRLRFAVEATEAGGEMTTTSFDYELPESYGVVVLECPQKTWTLGFGGAVGEIGYTVPRRPPGSQVLDCKNFGAPSGYTGSCKFTCTEDEPSWAFVGWDDCTCELPWAASIKAAVNSTGEGLELTAECTRKCDGGSFKVFNSDKSVQVAGWTLKTGRKWSLSLGSVEKLKPNLRGSAAMLFEWDPVETSTGNAPPTSPSMKYELGSDFGEVALECSERDWNLGFGGDIGKIPFKVPRGPPGDTILDCMNFGAPADYSGSCKFVCTKENPSWEFAGWDECLCQLPWSADVKVAVDPAGTGLQLMAQCSRRCEGGSFTVFNHDKSETLGAWELGKGSSWNLVISDIQERKPKLRGNRDMLIEWAPVEAKTGEKLPSPISKPYPLPEELGEVTFQCPDFNWNLDMGGKVGKIAFKVPTGPPGSKELDCKDFGAPNGYTGSCKFDCQAPNPQWGFVSWDDCSCEPPWGAEITSKPDSKGSGLELVAQCHRKCEGGKFEVLDSASKPVAAWTLGQGTGWSLDISEAVMAKLTARGKTLTFKWAPVEIGSGESKRLKEEHAIRDLLR